MDVNENFKARENVDCGFEQEKKALDSDERNQYKCDTSFESDKLDASIEESQSEAANESSEGCLEIDLEDDEADQAISESILPSKDSEATEEYSVVSELDNLTEEYSVGDLLCDESIPAPNTSEPKTSKPMPELTPIIVNKQFEELSENDAKGPDETIDMPPLLLIPENALHQIQDEKMREDIEQFLSTPEPMKPHYNELSDGPSSSRVSSANSSICSSDGKFKIVDSLLDKIRRKNSDGSGSEIPSMINQIISEDEGDLLVEIEPPVKLRKFGNNPHLMSTPVVNNQRSTSAFTNSEEEYNRTVAKHKPVKRSIVEEDKSQMGSKSEPPRMRAPNVPSNHQRPRTLAEKRQMFTNKNIDYLMVEQEDKIYKQVQRKHGSLELNYGLLDAMMLEDVPTNRGPWKVLTWLRTREGAYIQQYLTLDGTNFKLNGSRGNHKMKFLPPQSSRPLSKLQTTEIRSTRCCLGGRIRKRVLDALVNMPNIKKFVLEQSVDQYKRLETKFLDNQLVSIKPRPLSKKIEFINKNRKLLNGDEDSAFLGDYAKFEMPNINIEVTTTPRASLDPIAKSYLREILPHRDMDENWCNFALSALATDENTETFKFVVPYQDNKKNILVRQIIRAKEDTEMLRIPKYESDEEDIDEMVWTFAKDADAEDPLEREIIDIIKDLTNSVFINLNDDLFTHDDPCDRKVSSDVSPMKSKKAIDELSSIIKPNKSAVRVMKELKRLNANVYKSESQCVENDSDMRRQATAHLGKIERDLRPTVVVTGSDTVLLGTTENESRRIKRVPKKFADYTGTKHDFPSDDEGNEPSSKKQKIKPSSYSHDLQYKQKLKDDEAIQHFEETKSIRDEIRKMLHVRVDVQRLEYLEDLEPWCLIHKLYKCRCKGFIMTGEAFELTPPVEVRKKIEQPVFKIFDATKKTLIPRTSAPTPEPSSPAEPNEDNTDDGFSMRVLPVRVDNAGKEKPKSSGSAIFSSSDSSLPKIEIVSLSELINGGIGPIYINIYDDKTMRLNHVLRSLLNNKSAIIYFEGFGYFVDKSRVDIKKLDFSPLEDQLDHPIFILQAKDNFPSPVSSTMADEFVKFLFTKNSESFIQINDKVALKEVADIIESILRNVRKKLEARIGSEKSELVKEQLSMIKRDRSRSSSASTSISSANSSPLHFQGRQLIEAPPPGLDTPMMQEFNKIFSLRMQRLVGLVASNTLGLRPSNEMINKFYLYQWSLLLKSFEEDLVQIWQVTIESESNHNYQLMVLTDSRDVPAVEHAKTENIINIRKLSISGNISQLTRLILLRIEKPSMKNMTILFYGCKGYLRICGIVNSKESYQKGFIAKPSRATHPRIAAKIQKIYHIWFASKMAQEKRRVQLENGTPKNKEQSDKQSTVNDEPRKLPFKPITNELKKLEGSPTVKRLLNQPATIDMPLSSMARKPGVSDFKWFVFNITNDFSDIYIKSWRRYLPYRVIMEAIQRAKRIKRAVPLQSSAANTKRWPKIFALPAAPFKFKEQETMTEDYLIFGPYLRQTNSNLLLMQNVDGELMLRDEYERRNAIKRTPRTRCLWIYANTLKCVHNADPNPVQLTSSKGNDQFMISGHVLTDGSKKKSIDAKDVNGEVR